MTVFLGRATCALLLAGAACPALATGKARIPAPAPIAVPPIAFTQRTLANGLKVIAIRDTTTPNVTVQLWYDVGSKHDPEGRSGFAHLFEHILSRKTVNMPYNMINRLTEDVGGRRNASTWFDRTNYYEIVPAQYLETMLWTHAERMARPVVDAEVFETERNIVKEEFRQRILAPPYGRLRLVMDENSYDTLPNRRAGIGSLEQLDAATLADARAFHEAYYGPDTATLIVAGNFDPARLDALVDRYFAGIARRRSAIPLAITATERPRTSPRRVVSYAPNVPLPLVASSWRIPGSSHPDLAPLIVMEAILATGDSSRLRRALVDTGLATTADAQLSDVEDGGYFAPTVTLASGASIDAAEAALASEIARIRDRPATAAEVAEAKNEILADALRTRETFDGRAFAIGEALVRNGDARALDARLAAVRRVTAADVQRVARTYLSPQSRVDFRYLDEKARPAGDPGRWANPTPMPRWGSVPAATSAPLALAPEGRREQPPAPSAAVPVTPPVVAETRLVSGLKLVAARTGEVPIVTMTLVFPGGGSVDPAGRAGLSDMTALIATKGTATRTAQAIAAEMEALGAGLSTQVTPDGTMLGVTAPAATIAAAGRILVDIVRNASFPADEFARERRRSLDHLSVALRNPGTLASLALQPVIYGRSPYGTVTTPQSLGAITREELIAQRDRWWRPDTATLVMTGGIAPAEARRIADALFGDWRASGVATAVPAERAGAARAPRIVVIDMPGAGQAAVAVGIRAPERRDAGYADLIVANAELGGGTNGRLYQEVRVKRALSYGANSAVDARADDSLLYALAQTKNESAAEVIDLFLAEIDRLGREPLDPRTVELRKAFVAGQIGRQSETSEAFATTLARLIAQGLPAEEAVRMRERVLAVGSDAASAAAKRTVAAERASIVVVGDAATFIDTLRARHPQVEVIPAASLDLQGAPLVGQ